MNERGVGKVSLQHMHVLNARMNGKNARAALDPCKAINDNNKAVML